MPSAFEQIAGRHRDRVYTFACYCLGNPDDAEDVTQEVLLRLWRNWESLDEPRMLPWLIHVTRNACIDTLRRYSELPDSPLSEIEPDLTLAGKALKQIEELLELPPPLVVKWLQRRCAEQIDLSEVRKFGFLLTDPKRLETAPKVHGRDEAVEAILNRLFGETPRAVVVVSDVVSQLLSMESELSMGVRPHSRAGTRSIAPSGRPVDQAGAGWPCDDGS